MNEQNEDKTNIATNNEPQDTRTPEEVLAEMQNNMVPRAQYDALVKRHNDLFRMVATVQNPEPDKEGPTEEEQKKAFEENIKAIADTSQSMPPLEFFKRAIDVDDYLTSHGERSAFAPSDGEITPDVERSCRNTRDLLHSVIEQADGSNEVALAYLGNHMSDPAGMAALRRAR